MARIDWLVVLKGFWRPSGNANLILADERPKPEPSTENAASATPDLLAGSPVSDAQDQSEETHAGGTLLVGDLLSPFEI